MDNFPRIYDQHRELLVALFLCRELATLGIEMDEGQDVHLEIAKLVDPTAPNRLTDDGVRLFNQYSHGGYEVLREWFRLQTRFRCQSFFGSFTKKSAKPVW